MPSSVTFGSASEAEWPQATFSFRCIGCGLVTPASAQDFRCSRCGNLLEITDSSWKSGNAAALKAVWRERRSSNSALDLSGVWRFRELLPSPASEQQVVTLREGNTPLYALPQSSRSTGVERLSAKHQGMNPTGSFKDNGMSVAATFARQAGYSWVACASTGNTSASMAAYAARGGMRSLVLVPEGKISWSKLSQALDYGALTCQLRTDFDGCLRLLQELVKRAPVYQLNSINPFRIEGQKTLALELLEQLNWEPPDHIIVPGGNLGNSSAIGKALLEMLDLGLIPRLPKLSVIQAEGANALVRTLREAGGKRLISVQAETRATAIRIGNPASWEKAVKALQATGGACGQVSELEIAQAKAEIGAEGIGCEPASAVTLAGLKKLLRHGFVKPEESVVLILTGNLLKDPDFTMGFHRGDLFQGAADEREAVKLTPFRHPPVVLDATLDAVIRTLEQAEKSGPIPRMLRKQSARHTSLHLALPATSANLGPAFDAAALAMDLYITINARPAPNFSVTAAGRDQEVCQALENHLILATYSEILQSQGAAVVPLSLRMSNDIPIGKGCGSSAATRLAGIALANHFGRLRWSDARIIGEAARLEHHPDNASACWMGGLTVARMSENAEVQVACIRPKGKWPLLLAIPEQALSTEEARRALPAQYSRADTVANIQNSMLLLAAFVQGRHELLSVALQDRIHQPYRAPLCPLLPCLQELTGKKGVLGSALSGAGPSVIIFLDPRSSAQKTRKSIAAHLAANGLRAELLATRITLRGARRS